MLRGWMVGPRAGNIFKLVIGKAPKKKNPVTANKKDEFQGRLKNHWLLDSCLRLKVI